MSIVAKGFHAVSTHLPRLIFVLWLSGAFLGARSSGAAQSPSLPAVSLPAQSNLLAQIPPLSRHFVDLPPSEVQIRNARARLHTALLHEKLQGQWFAALVRWSEHEPPAITRRFSTWRNLIDYIEENDGLVEIWAYSDANRGRGRRIPATAMAALKKQQPEQPTFVTVTCKLPGEPAPATYRVEFGFHAADVAAAASAGYARHRELQWAVRQALSARDDQGRVSALAQWEALRSAVNEGRISLRELPAIPVAATDPFIAVEYEVDEFNNYQRVVQAFRDSEIQHEVVTGPDGQARQVLQLGGPNRTTREAIGFLRQGVSDELLPASGAVPGQDVVEMRVRKEGEPDPRRWNVLEFGEAELLKQSALAKFSLISAFLEKRRKEISLEKSKYNLIVEPIIAALNIGGGVAGVPFPMGEAARLGYNTLVTPWMIPPVPTIKQMRELFLLMTAKDLHPNLRTKPGDFLDPSDFTQLQEAARHVTDAEVFEYLQRISREDLRGMLRLARMQQIDAHLSNLLGLVADAGKVSGWTDEAGFQRDVFNSIYFSVTGEISIKNIIAVLAGGTVATPNSGVSLYDLSRGRGPAEAWLQYLNFTVDVRAIINTAARWSHQTLAAKELRKPFPYAPRLADLSAYEIRIFGFPLLIFHKRGLLKKDAAAFENDYAYGLIGATIVEHFPSRADMDAEIRAGRMVPLGYVRVMGADGRWKRTNLAVFAHRIPGGKHAGKTAVIIYGLKAYVEQSQLMERELKRFQEFDSALQHGGVIEQIVQAEDHAALSPEDLEPRVHVGSDAVDRFYSPLLGGLLEWRLYLKKKAWGLPMEERELHQVAGVLEDFAAQGIWLDDADALLGVDAYQSSFLYRRYVQGQARVMRVTYIPGREEVNRALGKAKESQQIERRRRAALSASGQGIALIHHVSMAEGHPEIGPLALVEDSAQGIETLLALLDRLPVTDRARLQFNHFAGTLVELDLEGRGRKIPFFLTLEFPAGQTLQRERTNPFTGERETLIYREGRWTGSRTAARILELAYDGEGVEIGSKLFVNAGSYDEPVQGALLEETHTLEVWHRDLNKPRLDPSLPMAAKLRVNHITGKISRDIYGLFPLPVATVDEQFIASQQFNDAGIFARGRVFENGRRAEDFNRARLAALLEPIVGRERFELTATLPANVLSSLADLKEQGYATTLQRRDLVKNTTRTETYDNARGGRKINESLVDRVEGTNTLNLRRLFEYRDDFFWGQIPTAASEICSPAGRELSRVQIAAYDPVSRRLTGVERDHTGRTVTNVWDYRWESPVEIQTAQRVTTNRFNYDETQMTGVARERRSGEEVAQLTGRYDPASRTWQLQRVAWHRPGITNQISSVTLSAAGRILSVRTADLLETHTIYAMDGTARAARTYRRNPASGVFDLLHQDEDDFRWSRGDRDARIQVYVDGQLSDSFRRTSDAEGRTVVDGVRSWPGLELKTVVAYDGGTERLVRASILQNGQARLQREFGPASAQPDGSQLLSVRGVPFWGMSFTETFRVGDPLARCLSKRFENGDSVRVTQWFDGTSIPRQSELQDRHGRLKERFTARLNAGREGGLPFDLVHREALSPWGQAFPAEQRALLQGTELALFKETGRERIYYDLTVPFELPWLTVDPKGERGRVALIRNQASNHVMAVSTGRIDAAPTTNAANAAAETQLTLQSVNLRALLFHQVSTRTIDRAGNVLEERISRFPALRAGPPPSDEALRQAAAQAPLVQRFRYRYDQGWLVERSDRTGGRMLAFVPDAPAPGETGVQVNDAGREHVTSIEGYLASAPPAAGPDAGADGSLFRRIHSPVQLERNAFMPQQTSLWTAWVAAEYGPGGHKLFDSERIFDAQGRLSISKTTKNTRGGTTGTRIAYQLPEWAEIDFTTHPLSGTNSVPLNLQAATNLAGSDFIWFRLQGASNVHWAVDFLSRGGQRVRLDAAGSSSSEGRVSPWPLGAMNTRWLPDRVGPRRGALVQAPEHEIEGVQTVAAAVADLAKAGLDIGQVSSATLHLQGQTGGVVRVSSIATLVSGDGFVAEDQDHEILFETLPHPSGLTALTRSKADRTDVEWLGGLEQEASVELHGLPVALVRPRSQLPVFPTVTILDSSDPDAPRPLYALSLREGRFLEHYRMPESRRAQVYTVVNGFDVPRYDLFDASFLDDEVSPGATAYGYDYAVSLDTARGRHWLTHGLATLRNRIAANIFRLAGRELSPIRADSPISLSYRALHEGSAQAEAINRLPMLGELLLGRPLPWTSTAPPSSDLAMDRRRLAIDLLQLHVRKFLTGEDSAPTDRERRTGLIPTSIYADPQAGSRARPLNHPERFVDTRLEGEIIGLAVALREYGLARALLDYYAQKSDGGTKLLHSSYDAETQAAKAVDPLYQRPPYAKQSAGAQLAIAEAAFLLGTTTRDVQALRFATNLLRLVLRDFRHGDGVRLGITEYELAKKLAPLGVRLWPEREVYSLRSNARAYLLLKRMSRAGTNNAVSSVLADRGWIEEALRSQEQWLRSFVLPHVERTGIVPKGLFEIQDVHEGTTALAVERWTSAGDWLAFLEAAMEMGLPRERIQSWLENLARVHGTTVNAVWGLDWSIPLVRPDAISPELTAQFYRVAEQLGHAQAAGLARQSLLALRRPNGTWPEIVTAADPTKPLQTGQGFFVMPHSGRAEWARTLGVEKEILRPDGSPAPFVPQHAGLGPSQPLRPDMAVFVSMAALFYLSILLSTIFWWRFRALRHLKKPDAVLGSLVPEVVMQRAEERWAKRVLGVQTPPAAEKTRFSNATVEQNFLMQLRAIYKLVLEWRRQENGWAEDDPRLAEDESDDWLNGLDEFASVVGIYMRWVIKAGAKDGFDRQDFLRENEDSNHIWSRLVMYFSEYYWAMLTLVSGYQSVVTYDDKADYYGKFSKLLNAMGLRQRDRAFDARQLFNYPANPHALDLLVLQKPGATLEKVLLEVSLKLKIPYTHLVGVIEKYKQFKKREDPYPIHPYTIELAKVLPHFVLMGLGALVWFNQSQGESPIVAYLWSVITDFTLEQPGLSLVWGVPLLASLGLSVMAYVTRIYRFEGSMLPRGRQEMLLDVTLTSLFVKSHDVLPQIKPGTLWKPEQYEWAGWALRAVGFLGLGWALLIHPAPSFATFLVLKGILAMLALMEVAAIVLPLALTAASKFLQDRVSAQRNPWRLTRFLNQLNLTATRPASPLWLAVKYHMQPSVPTGGFWGLAQAVVFYFLLGGTFFLVGGFLCQEMFPLWFTEKYLASADWRLFFGGLFFWNTMYLLRYGLFLFFTGAASALASFPVKGLVALLATVQLLLLLLEQIFGGSLAAPGPVAWPVTVAGLIAMWFESDLLAALRRKRPSASPGKLREKLERVRQEKSATLGVVYMSGDDLSYLKLTPALLMSRWRILRDRLDSDGIRLLFQMAECPADAELEAGFKWLYETEKTADVTLWHPMQLSSPGEPSCLGAEAGLRIAVPNEEQRQRLLQAWHLRRWLVTMMSTAGHAQDTAINLVDIALRLAQEGWAEQTVFYLIQNKYDNNENNRPVQTPYHQGELGQREKLARLLCAVAPGLRAYSVQNWTPFGFKAGGLTGMDLVHEEALRLTTMLVLDRNANVHDLDALMQDLARALTDPDLVIVIPGRGTTNTRTPLGQGSQMVEEGHRSFLKGLMGCLGGTASESVGTGWGNLLGVLYGRVQRAMVDPITSKMPLTSRMRRGSSFQVRTEGLIGFTPHAVGISEDTWAVSQAMHNSIALGRRVKFQLSQAIWHKIRETWSHSEWLASFPRWSGGYLQMMHDPLMQRINDFGPASVFAKEVRANSGRNFLTAPFALLNIVLMPLAIMLDVTPFVQILVVLWNFGFIMNQILTVHGLNTYLESSGFYRLPALVGAGGAAIGGLLLPSTQAYGPALTAAGFLVGGFFPGLGRWLYNRVRDMILFGPQLVLHALGQVVRQSLEFTVSGASPEDAKGVNMAFRAWAGPREDRPHDRFANLINLRTIVWVVGLLSVLLNIFALSNLDMLNVLLLLPSLLFSVSALVGPFLMTPKVGSRIGQWIALPKLLGWITSLAFYTCVSLLIGHSAVWRGLGAVLFCGLLGLLLWRALRYGRFHRRLSLLGRQVSGVLLATGTEPKAAEALAVQVLQNGSDPMKVQPVLNQGGVPAEHQVTVMKLVEEKVAPVLRAPILALERGRLARSRSWDAYARSLVLSLFVLLWFFIVPVPGLFVFTAREYRICIELSTIVTGLSWGIGLTLVSYWIGLWIENVYRSGRKGAGLTGQIHLAFLDFRRGQEKNRFAAHEVSSLYALFTDAQTYLDQRSYEYARRVLAAIRAKLS